MSALICGSLAYDTIMVFQDQFKNHILPDKVHLLSVSFMVPQLRREFGGCAGNIAYNLKLLGGEPVPGAVLGGRREQRRVDVELDAGRAGQLDQAPAHDRRQGDAVGGEAGGQHLHGVRVLAHRDELAHPAEQVVVDPAGQGQQQVVRRVPGRALHRALPSGPVGQPSCPTGTGARQSLLDSMMTARW